MQFLIFKKDDHTSCNNYHPISLLSNISEIIERLTHSGLMTFLNTNEVLHERITYGANFRKNTYILHKFENMGRNNARNLKIK